MKSPRDNVTTGLKSVGLDGGIDTKTDPVQIPPPKTTTADNAWFITPGQVRQLPSGAGNILGSSYCTYTVTPTAIGAGNMLAVQDTPIGTTQLAQPNLVQPGSNLKLSPTPAYQANFRTRVYRHTVGPLDGNASDSQFVTPDAPIAGYQPFAWVNPSPNLGTNSGFRISTGDMTSQNTNAPQLYTMANLAGVATTVKPTLSRAEPIPGNATQFLLVYQGNANQTLYCSVMPYANPGGAAYATAQQTVTLSSNCMHFTVMVEGQKVWVVWLEGTSGPTVKMQQVTATGTSGSVRTGPTVSGTGQIAARYLDTMGMAFTYQSSSTLTLYGIDDSVWQAGNTTTSLSTSIYSAAMNFGTTIGLARNAVTNLVAGAVFFMGTENIINSGLTAYGLKNVTECHVGCVTFSCTSATTWAGTTATTAKFFRTPRSTYIMSGCFSPNYQGPAGQAGSATNTDFICPIVTGFTSPQNSQIFVQPKYYLINSQVAVVGRWGDDAGGYFYPSNNQCLRKTSAVVANNSNATVEFHMPFFLNVGLYDQYAAPVSGSATYIGSGFPDFRFATSGLATWSFQSQNASCPPVVSGRSLVFGGSLSMLYDGQTLHEASFHHRPSPPIIGTVTSSGSSGITITTTSGSTTATVSDSTQLFIGETVTGTGIATGTVITDIPSKTSVTLSTAATANGTGNALTTQCSYQYVVVWSWVDAQGLVHRSPPSLPVQVNFNSSYTAFGTVNMAVPNLDSTHKLGSGFVTFTVYRTPSNKRQFYAVYSSPVSQADSTMNGTTLTQNDLYSLLTDNMSDQALLNPIAANTNVVLDLLYTSADGSYASYAPPPFMWQIASGGRHYGLACVQGFYRVYFSQQWDESSPPEWNNFCYLPVPPELGDIRSMAAYQSNILIFGTRGLGTFSGAGPSRQIPRNSDGTVANGASLATLYNANFTLVTPLPTPAGVRGTGSPVSVPQGIVYQDRAGFMMVDGSLNLNYVGADVEGFTGTLSGLPTTTYGHGTLCESLHAVVWANPQGAALVYDYAGGRFSTWSAMLNLLRIVQAPDKALYSLQQSLVSGLSQANAIVQSVNAFGASVVVETPWLSPSPVELDVGQTNSYSSSAGEGNVWETELFGQYLSAHTIKIETALNYGNYSTANGWTTLFTVPTQPAQYQFRFRPPTTSRIWAIRYRLTLAPLAGNGAELARLGGLVIYSGVDTSVTRLGKGFSR